MKTSDLDIKTPLWVEVSAEAKGTLQKPLAYFVMIVTMHNNDCICFQQIVIYITLTSYIRGHRTKDSRFQALCFINVQSKSLYLSMR